METGADNALRLASGSNQKQYTDEIVNQVWSIFIQRLPQMRPAPEDITPHLPSIHAAYRQHVLDYYTETVAGMVEIGGNAPDEIPQIIDFMYQQILRKDLHYVKMSSSVPITLEHFIPDPNLGAFDANYRTLCTACAMRIADAEHNGTAPVFADEGETLEETVANQRQILDMMYDMLLPRTQFLRQEDYENAICILDYMEGKTDLLPIDVLNKRSLFHTAWSR